jgi:hypothetical protein
MECPFGRSARISVGLPITNVAVIAVPLVLVECPPYHRGHSLLMLQSRVPEKCRKIKGQNVP